MKSAGDTGEKRSCNYERVVDEGEGSCCSCLGHFPATSIQFLERDKSGDTVFCPICGTDAVLPGYIESELLAQMQKHFFTRVEK
jgi:hypothetical protein